MRVACAQRDESELPQTYVDYDEQPREYFLNAVSTILDVHTRISDLYSSPHDQIKEQLRLTIETIKERQEAELIKNPDYGLLANVAEEQRILTLTGAPTPVSYTHLDVFKRQEQIGGGGVKEIVADLHAARDRWRAAQQRSLEFAVREFPAREALKEIAEALCGCLLYTSRCV